jgi:hypothetical protein
VPAGTTTASPTALLAASRNTMEICADTDAVNGDTRPPNASFSEPESIALAE